MICPLPRDHTEIDTLLKLSVIPLSVDPLPVNYDSLF